MKQIMGGEYPDESYFMYTGLFLHLWSILEWVIADIVFEKGGTPNLKSREELFTYLNIDGEGGKLDKVKTIFGDTLFSKINNGPKRLRHIIAHNQVCFGIHIGAYQPENGFIKCKKSDRKKLEPCPDEAATKQRRETLTEAQKTNPSITEEEINTPVYSAYSEQEIKNEIVILLEVIEELGYNINTDNVSRYFNKKGLL